MLCIIRRDEDDLSREPFCMLFAKLLQKVLETDILRQNNFLRGKGRILCVKFVNHNLTSLTALIVLSKRMRPPFVSTLNSLVKMGQHVAGNMLQVSDIVLIEPLHHDAFHASFSKLTETIHYG
jgi:hypothetical protein